MSNDNPGWCRYCNETFSQWLHGVGEGDACPDGCKMEDGEPAVLEAAEPPDIEPPDDYHGPCNCQMCNG
jgi:hypothetical protein